MPVREAILSRCRELGFALAGVCDAREIDRAGAFRAWLASGRHGEMAYLERHADRYVSPETLVDGAASVVCVADRYHDGGTDDGEAAGQGRIARYARGRDYHITIKKRLHRLADELRAAHPGHVFRTCVDTAPVAERDHAQRAGLGAVGKHTLLIEPGVGSYLLLGEIVTTLAIEPDPDRGDADPCGTCTRCIDACPTDAITPWSIDATRCISYLTIEHRSAIDPALHPAIGDWIFGCDVCQEVCPHNQPTERTRSARVHPDYAPGRRGLDLLDVLGWDEAARREAFAGTALKRARLAMMKRNAIIAAGNLLRIDDHPALRARIEELAIDPAEDDLVRHTARAVLRASAP